MRPALARLLVPLPVLMGMTGLLVAIEGVVIASQADVMRSWASSIEAIDGAWLPLSVLVVGGAAAVSVGPWQQRELTAALPDSGVRITAARGVVVGLVAAAVHGAVAAGVLVWGYLSGLPGNPRLWPVLGVMVGLWACAMFGTAVVRLGAGALSSLLAMGLYVAMLLVIRALGGSSLVDLGGASVVLVGLAPDTVAMLSRAAWLGATGGVLWLLASLGKGAWRHPASVPLVLVAVACAMVTIDRSSEGFTRASVQWACHSGPPRVCVSQEFESRLPSYARAITRLAPAAQSIGLAEPPDGFKQAVGARPGVGSFNVDSQVDWNQLTFDLVQFSFPCSREWNEAELRRADVVAAWMGTQVGVPPPPGVQTPSRASARRALTELRCD